MPNLKTKLVTGFIVAQIAVPALALGARWVTDGSHPVREFPLSWQMYSAADVGTFVGIKANGEEVKLSTDGLPPILRGVGYGQSVHEMLCEANPDVVNVRRETTNRSLESVEITC